MTTTTHLSVLTRRFAPGVAAVALLIALSVPVFSSALTCREVEVAAAAAADVPESRGIDLEIRVLHVRVEFPWLKSLPITPAHRIVIAWMAGAED